MVLIIVNSLNTSANASRVSATPNLSARGTELYMGEPERVESPMDMLTTCMHVQSIVSDLQRPENKSEHPKQPEEIKLTWYKPRIAPRHQEIVDVMIFSVKYDKYMTT